MTDRDATDRLWYKDAVIYELHVRSFFDSNNDGMGDFKGLTSRLDYLEDLGVNAIWLLPFYPSPWRDDGYDISDYKTIHRAYGSLREFKTFLKEAHARNLRVITELVINHTSNQHPWFERARKANPGTKYRDYYVWSDTPDKYTEARIIFQDFETSNWTWDPVAKAYYWHRFYSHQPDLNFDNPDVQQEVFKLLDYWFDMGVDGLRLDAVPYLFERENSNCENLPETHEFLKAMRTHVEQKFPGRMLLAEANQWPEDAVSYFGDGDECHMAFHFPLMPRLFMAMKMEDSFPVIDILEQTPRIPDTAQWGIFLRNHDELTLEMVTDEERDYMYRAFGRDPRHRINLGIRRRLAPLLDNNRRGIELLNSLLFSLPGTPVIYYGDEIGMGDNVYLGDRDGVRTPMQWSSNKNSGFSTANPQRLYLPVIIDPEYHHEAINVETQQANGSSLLWWMKRIIAARRRFPAFSRGEFTIISTDNHRVFAFVRHDEEHAILVVVNFSRHTQVAHLDLESFANHIPEEVFSGTQFPRVREEEYTITIGSHDYYWLLLEPAEESSDGGGITQPKIPVSAKEWSSLSSTLEARLTGTVLGPFLRRSRWFRDKSLKIRKVTIQDSFAYTGDDSTVWMLVVGVAFTSDRSDSYLVPIGIARGENAETIRAEYPAAVLADVSGDEEEGVIYDGVLDRSFREQMLSHVASRKRINGRNGAILIDRTRQLKKQATAILEEPQSKVLGVEQSNTSILYKDALFLKLYRKLENGQNPDVECLRYLTEERHFPNVPEYVGALNYDNGEGDPAALGLLIDFVPNQGDAWSYTRHTINDFFEKLLIADEEGFKPIKVPRSLLSVKTADIPDSFLELADGFFLDMIELLGRRTGELHLSLGAETENKAFAPEPFSKLYQRSLYQSLRSQLRRVQGVVRKAKSFHDEETQDLLDQFLQSEETILERFGRISGQRIDARKIRIHGDYHLGQVLFTGRDFIIIDLEGEPARTLSERRLKFSPFRDVAGMLRSFHYAIYGRYLEATDVRPEDAARISPWLLPWYTYVGGTFLESYLKTVDDAPFVPKDKESIATMLDVFLLEKAVYEVNYELNNRPEWIRIPLDGIEFVLGRE
ncbi:MAG: maltose alpha-D-glucosyltransferase [Alkalispirochaeta sp.]